MNVYIGKEKLPSAYQEVEYIETTGTQFIDTGLYAGNNIQVETKIAVNSTSQPQIIFACYKSSGSDDLPNYYGLAAYQNRWYYGLNGSEGNGGTYSPTIGTEYVIVYNNANNYININGSDVLNCAGTTGYAGTTLGIAVRANRNLSGSFKYYYFRMYNKTTGAYERDMIPCYRKSDGVIGMYDLVNDQFYTNSGSGTFSKGNDVNKTELKNDYIGEGVITEIYTEAKFGNSTSGVTKTKSIYKAGYKVVKIEFDTTISAGSNTAYGAVNLEAIASNTSTHFGAYILFEGSISGNYAYSLYFPGDAYLAPTSPIFGYTTAHVEITPDYVSLRNGTGTINKTHSFSASSKAQIETYFSQSDIGVYLEAIYPYLGPTTITVTYMPN